MVGILEALHRAAGTVTRCATVENNSTEGSAVQGSPHEKG